MMVHKSVVLLLCIAVIVSAVADKNPYRTCAPAPQGNKVSLPDPPFTCVKDHNGRWVCTEGGRDA